ncbi:MAG: hypothetical protein J1F63_02500 [Oscillospiraceae bacterium]|nr:hypothetical protein [Oscillospiraceae bacterium]
MLNEEMAKKIAALVENEEAVKAFSATQNVTERVDVLKQYGIDVTEAELSACESILINTKDGELTEENLKSVSGGLLISIGAVVLVGGLYAATLGGLYELNKIMQ